jgi:hypothetical protein
LNKCLISALCEYLEGYEETEKLDLEQLAEE